MWRRLHRITAFALVTGLADYTGPPMADLGVALGERTLWQAFLEAARADPARQAVIADDEAVSYGELSRLASQAALGFLELGIREGDKVALWLPDGVPFLAAALGAWRIGAIVVAVNPRFRAGEVAYVLGQSDSVAVVLSEQAGSTNQVDLLRQIWAELPGLQHAVCLAPDHPGLRAWSNLLALGAQHASNARLASAEREVQPSGVALFQYTSGSTAFPKAVMLSHATLARNAWHVGEALALTPEDTYLVPLPSFHVGGLVTGALAALERGSRLVVMARFDPEAMLRLIQTHRCTTLAGVETTYLMALNHPEFGRYDLSSLRKCLALGTGELIRRIHTEMGIASVCTLYGMSELGPNVTLVHVGEPLETSLRTMGRPHPGIELRIADPETGAPLAPNQTGEICVRGWNLMQGYYKQPEETARIIDAEGWLHTGDLGQLDAQGYLVFVGRLKHVVRVGGENVSAEEVEDCLTAHPAVKVAQVVAGPDPRLGEVCVGYVELRESAATSEEELIAYCRERLAGFKVPRRIRFVGEWPMTGSGKIQRLQLKELEFARAESGG
jgi:acyl-CoA synthetase (AMP-forming)/AMP-acid ligase II